MKRTLISYGTLAPTESAVDWSLARWMCAISDSKDSEIWRPSLNYSERSLFICTKWEWRGSELIVTQQSRFIRRGNILKKTFIAGRTQQLSIMETLRIFFLCSKYVFSFTCRHVFCLPESIQALGQATSSSGSSMTSTLLGSPLIWLAWLKRWHSLCFVRFLLRWLSRLYYASHTQTRTLLSD